MVTYDKPPEIGYYPNLMRAGVMVFPGSTPEQMNLFENMVSGAMQKYGGKVSQDVLCGLITRWLDITRHGLERIIRR